MSQDNPAVYTLEQARLDYQNVGRNTKAAVAEMLIGFMSTIRLAVARGDEGTLLPYPKAMEHHKITIANLALAELRTLGFKVEVSDLKALTETQHSCYVTGWSD